MSRPVGSPGRQLKHHPAGNDAGRLLLARQAVEPRGATRQFRASGLADRQRSLGAGIGVIGVVEKRVLPTARGARQLGNATQR